MAPSTVSDTEWLRVKDAIKWLYVDQNMTLGAVRKHLLQHYAFSATQYQYTTQLSAWGFTKNNSRQTYEGIHGGLKRRNLDADRATVSIDGKALSSKKLKKELKRYTKPGFEDLDDRELLPATPPNVSIEALHRADFNIKNNAGTNPGCFIPTYATLWPTNQTCSTSRDIYRQSDGGDDAVTTSLVKTARSGQHMSSQARSLIISLPGYDFMDLWATWHRPRTDFDARHLLPGLASQADYPWATLPLSNRSMKSSSGQPHSSDIYAVSTGRETSQVIGGNLSLQTHRDPQLGTEGLQELQQTVGRCFDIRDESKTLQEHLRPYIIETRHKEVEHASQDLMHPTSVDSIRILSSYIALLLSNDILSNRAVEEFVRLVEKTSYLDSLSLLTSGTSPTTQAVMCRILHAAVRIDATRFLAAALKNGADRESRSCGGSSMTLLQRALKVNRSSTAKLLIDAGANVNADVNSSRNTPSCMGRKFHESELDCPCTYRGLESPLRLAADSYCCVDLIMDLLENGAKLPLCPVLSHAIAHGAEEYVVQALIKAGADLDQIDLSSLSKWSDPYCLYCPLATAAARSSPAVVALLLDKGADPNCRTLTKSRCLTLYDDDDEVKSIRYDALGLPLFLAARRFGVDAQHDQDMDITRTLLQHDADPNLSVANFLCLKESHSPCESTDSAWLMEYGRVLHKNLRPGRRHGLELYALQIAAEKGNMDMTQLLVEAGACTDFRIGTSPLSSAIQALNFNGARYLLDAKADPDGVGLEPYCPSPLISAVNNGNLAMIDELLTRGADVDKCSAVRGGRTPLQRAAELGDTKVIDHLIKRGASLAAAPAPFEGVSTLQGFVENGLNGYVDMAIRAGAPVNPVSVDGKMPLMAAIKRHSNSMVETLLAAGADVHRYAAFQDGNGNKGSVQDDDSMDTETWDYEDFNLSPIQLAAFYDDVPIATILCAAGADVNQPAAPDFGYTALTIAILRENFDMLKFLLSTNADLHQGDECEAAIVTAVSHGSTEIVTLLISRGENPNHLISIDDPGEETLLARACLLGDADMVRCLLHAGADPSRGGALAHSINLLSDETIPRLLLDHGADVNEKGHYYGTPLQTASTFKKFQLARELIRRGADVNAAPSKDSRGRTALQAAAETGSVDIVEELLRNGADVNQQGHYYKTPLQTAISANKFQLACELIRWGADVNAAPSKDSRGRTALQAAAETGSVDIVEELLKSGADVNASAGPDSGVTALQAAAIRGYLHIAQILLQHGARIDAPACPVNGRTAIDGAAEFGRIDMVKLLLDNYHGPINKRELIELAYRAAKRGKQWYVMALLKSMNGAGGIGNPMAGGVPPYV